jgi:dynein heavy chain
VRKPKLAVPVTNLNMIAQLCSLLDACMTDNARTGDPQIMEALFIFVTIWSVGACVVQVRAAAVKLHLEWLGTMAPL